MVYFFRQSLGLRLIATVGSLLFLLFQAEGRADQLTNINHAGVIRVAIFDANPPFGSIDPKTHHIVGYDADFAHAIADALGVKLLLIPTNPANRIPLLQSGKVDLIIADFTITKERSQVIDFSIPYFVTGQQFLVPHTSSNKLNDYALARIGTVKGTTSQQVLRKIFPNARILAYDDIPLALSALRNGNVKAITQDSTILAGLLAITPDKKNYKILRELVSEDHVGIGVKKGETALLNEINKQLILLEDRGEAKRIYDNWFGPKSLTPQQRLFTIKSY